jgi:hypothetical protein
MSTRRQLEQDVIAGARAAAGALELKGEPTVLDQLLYSLLKEPLDALDKLKPLSGPRTARCAPITSHTAAKWVTSLSHGTPLAPRIFYMIYWCDRDRVGSWGGYTTDELIVRTGKGHASVSARVNELANAGWIVDSGQRRATRSGQPAIVWVASEAAKAAFEEGRVL